ncbi:MAG: Crp/Fnr family transcriptional regulator [Deltaproteobacteria bacterium]|nr:MAG: Crp/Fnr family transcriptional regulator [Deltaproteobacteria bacterium]
MQDPRRILWYLKKIPLLAELGPEVLARLADLVDVREVRRRDVVYLPGDPGDAVFFVNGGRIKISKVTRDGKALTLSYCGPSEMFGETCLVDGGPRAEMAEAMDNSMITEIPRPDFERLIRDNAQLGYQMVRILAGRRRDIEDKLEALVFRDVTSKLAELLLNLAEEYGVEDARGTLVQLKITHQELANLIGSTRETVSLTLSQFKKKKYITTEGRKVIISDPASLRALF